MNRVVTTALLLTLICGSRSAAQFWIVIDAQKDSFYTQLERPEDGHIQVPHTDFLPLSGPRPDSDRDLSADVWAAWDQEYLYVYAEVRDDSVCGTSIYSANNDCIELKFDPDPSKKAWSGIVNARLSALDSADAAEIQGVDNLYVERHLDSAASHPSNYARRRTSDGYVLELRLAWEWLTVKDRNVSAGVGNVFGFSVTFHDNDSDTRDGSIQWSVGMADEVWLVPQLLGTVEFQEDHRLKFIRANSIDPSARPGKTYLSMERFDDPHFPRLVIENWKYNPGDDPEWARPECDDRDWETVRALMPVDQLPEGGWEGIGWFRAVVAVDSSFRNIPIAFWMTLHAGASELYVDGELLYSLGTVGTTREKEEPRREINPRFLVLSGEPEHVFAVRYSNFQRDKLDPYEIPLGFDFVLLRDVDTAVTNAASSVRLFTVFQAAFTAVPLLLVLLHIFLFVHYPRAKENLYFAGAVLFWALVIFTNFTRPFTDSVVESILLIEVLTFAVGLGLIFMLLTTYEILLARIPKHFVVFVVAAIGMPVWFYIAPSSFPGISIYVLIGLTMLELTRVLIVSGSERRRQRWITAAGFAAALLAIAVQVLMELGVIPAMIIYPYGLVVLSVVVSFDLAKNFAKTRKNLEVQLLQVQELSKKTLEQERRAKENEITRKVLEADNARKTRELEEARKLQLSMLPNTVPAIPYLDIAVYMKPATEVGGDYYDFHCGDNGMLTVAVGDATGHGMKAGTMVATIKGLFSASNGSLNSLPFFELCTRTIREMHLGNLYMALMLAKIQPGTMTIASAGMPPVLIHRRSSESVEKIVIKGMPLGAHAGFPYEQKETALSPGDTILFMSDGFLELFNHQKELLGAQRVEKLFAETADQSPHIIIDHLNRTGEEWCNGEPPHDDITFVVVKVKE
ncbi:MAG: SpoIIE family protein phosphatase [Bacteroidetes bacterium]|nr:SpoIIE family protein phosphatase [Bacteroidota bacterium]